MKYKYIADTSVWIQYFRQSSAVVDFMEKALDTGCLMIIGPVITELLQGIRSSDEMASVIACIDAVPVVETTQQVWINAGILANKLRKQGITLPLADVLIAAAAKEYNLIILTYDKHFSYIEGISTYQP